MGRHNIDFEKAYSMITKLRDEAKEKYKQVDSGYEQAKYKGRMSGLNSALFWLDYYLNSEINKKKKDK